MMKIRSIIDVITNSSTEVFLLETTKTIPEVSDILSKITSGYEEPEMLGTSSPILGVLYDFGYLYHKNSERDHQRYIYWVLSLDNFSWEIEFEETPPPLFEGIIDLWKDYVWKNKNHLEEEISKKCYYYEPAFSRNYLIPGLPSLFDYIPEDFLSGFIKNVLGENLPDFLNIPETRTVEYWIGKIGFSGEEDNSVPYEDWDKIHELFGGTRFHLG